MSIEKLPIGTIEAELDPKVREILNELYKKKFEKNDAALGRELAVHGSTVKRWREDQQVPGWVLLFIWRHWSWLLRDKIIDESIRKDPTHDLTPDESALVHDFAAMLKRRRDPDFERFQLLMTKYGMNQLIKLLEDIGREAAHELKGQPVTEVIEHGYSGAKTPSDDAAKPDRSGEKNRGSRNSNDSKTRRGSRH